MNLRGKFTTDKDGHITAITQRAIGSVIHDQKRHTIGQAKIQRAHNMRMHEAGNGLGFALKLLHHARQADASATP